MCKQCTVCLEKKPIRDFYLQTGNGRPHGRCKSCWKLYTEKRKAKDPERYKSESLAATKRWQAKNPERTMEIRHQWDRDNKKRRSELSRRYREKNPHRYRKSFMNCATPAWANEFFIAEAYRLARLRTKMLGFKWNVDHIVPLRSKIVCGLHAETNLQVIPKRHNQKKNNRYWPDMP